MHGLHGVAYLHLYFRIINNIYLILESNILSNQYQSCSIGPAHRMECAEVMTIIQQVLIICLNRKCQQRAMASG